MIFRHILAIYTTYAFAWPAKARLRTAIAQTVCRGLSCAAWGAAILFATTAPVKGQCEPQEIAKLTASDAAQGDLFGGSVAVEGDTAVVGAHFDDHAGGTNAGSAYVFVRSADVWTLQAKLTASDAAENDNFGSSVALSGDTAVVGANSDDNAGGTNAGSAYVFVRSGGVWTEQAKLIASDAAVNDLFGGSVAVSGDTVVVGAWQDDHPGGTDAGSAYVFVRSGDVWTEQAKLTASDAAAEDYFGLSVALSGDTALVGAFFDDHANGINAGSGYVFTRSGAVWTEQAKLIASDAAESDNFGLSVAVLGDTALVGAVGYDDAGGTDAGATYVFVRSDPGAPEWTEQAKLTASDAAENDLFGWSVSLSADTALVGAFWDDHTGGTDAGSAYVFTRAGTLWTEQAKLIASDAAAGDEFGKSVAMSGDTAVVGAHLDDHAAGGAGSAYAFIRAADVWTEQAKLIASDAAAGDEFGISVAISGDTAVVGARRDDNETGVNAGSAYVYVRSGPPGEEVWMQQAKLIGNEPVYELELGSETGISVAISGDTALVGSWLWPNVNATGLAYVFVRSGEVWTQQAVLYNPQFGSYQYYGYAVALEGDSAVIGTLAAPGLNVGGQAFFAARTGESWTQQQKFPSDGVPGDQFGNSVAMSPSEDTAVIGAWLEDNAGGTDAGSAYVFVKSGNSWIEQAKLTASDGAADDRFGVKVAISGDTILVGAYQDDDAGSQSGSAYVFTRSGEVWTEQAKLTASDAMAGDGFGVSLAFSGDTAVIGAYADDEAGGVDAGSAYVFTRSGDPGSEVWTEQYKLTASDGGATDWFGAAVAFSGDTPVIGARQDDHDGGINAGSAYVFDLGCDVACCAGDFDGDNAVTDADIAGLIAALLDGAGCPAPPACCPGDFNSDGMLDGDDIPGFVEKLFSDGACP